MKKVIILVFALSVCLVAQDKGKKKSEPVVSLDTLVSRVALIEQMRSQVEALRRDAESTITVINGRIQMLEIQRSVYVLVPKSFLGK